MRAVRAGGDRQDAHERIRQLQHRGGARAQGRRAATTTCSIASRPTTRSASRATSWSRAIDPRRFVGRAPRAGRRVPRRGRRAAARRRRRASADAGGGARMTRRRADAPLPLPLLRRGKVREVYVVDDDRLLLVATDRVSAFDVVMARARAVQGRRAHAAHRVVAARSSARSCRITCSAPTPTRSSPRFPRSPPHRDALAGRAMLCRAHRGVSRRVRRARLSLRLGVEGVRSERARSPASRLPPGLRRERPLRSAALLARRRRRRRATTRTSPSREVRERLGADVARRARAAEPARLRARPRRRGGARHHHRRYEVRVRPRSRRARSG